VLCDLHGLDYENAALVLKVPIGTVRSRLHRGRHMLAERLARSERPIVGIRRALWRKL
jgi:RNA polymerase sigma-70 factor (ECF subfamily)